MSRSTSHNVAYPFPMSQCLPPFPKLSPNITQDDSRPKRAEHCSVNTAFLAQTMLTHQAQSCRTKTNIYLYKHIKLFSSNPYEKGDPAMQQAGPASSTAGRLALELAACSHFGLQRCCRAFEAATFPQLQRSHSARTALNVLPLVTAASSEDGATDIISLNHWTAAVCVTARI